MRALVQELELPTSGIYTGQFASYQKISGKVRVGWLELWASGTAVTTSPSGLRVDVLAAVDEREMPERLNCVTGTVKVSGDVVVPSFVQSFSPGAEAELLLCSFVIPRSKMATVVPPDLSGGPLKAAFSVECCLQFSLQDAQDGVWKGSGRSELEHLSDLTVKTSDGGSILAHKVVLSMKSRVFAAMFSHDTAEASSGLVRIVDFDEDTVENMVEFMYRGKLDDSSKFTMELLKIADKYDVPDLKKACAEELLRSLSKENASKVWVVADLIKAEGLKQGIEEFLVDHFKAQQQSNHHEPNGLFVRVSNGPQVRAVNGQQVVRRSNDPQVRQANRFYAFLDPARPL